MITFPFTTGVATVLTDTIRAFTTTVEIPDASKVIIDYQDTGYVIEVSRFESTSQVFADGADDADQDAVFEVSGVDRNGQKFLIRDVRPEDAIWVLKYPFAIPADPLRKLAVTYPLAEATIDAVTTADHPNGAVHTVLLTVAGETFGRYRHGWVEVPDLKNLDGLVLTQCKPEAVTVFDRAQDYRRVPSLQDMPLDADDFMAELRVRGVLI